MTQKFKVIAPFEPTGDQPQAIEKLVDGLKYGFKNQVLLGVTGSGKTFTMAKVIEKIQKPTLIISHNKTLAAQLYQEFRDFFPDNAVEYFVSYYDYYMPEAYIPQTDTYIEKETEINEEIDRLRLSATTSLLTRKDVIVVASVSCIYGLGSPKEYGRQIIELEVGKSLSRDDFLQKLVQLHYERNDYELSRSRFRVRGENIELIPAHDNQILRVEMNSNTISGLKTIDPQTGKITNNLQSSVVYPAKHYITSEEHFQSAQSQIEKDVEEQVQCFEKQGKFIEAQRIKERVAFDLEQIREFGYCNGIENYSRYFDGRKSGEPPYTLLDFFLASPKGGSKDFLLIVDESHMTIPQIRGMYLGDRSRKQTLIDFGFRLPAAIDNRPLKFNEFETRIYQTIYTSATPALWEINKSEQIVEQLIRPTGLLDPEIIIKPTKGQVDDLISEIEQRIKKKERVLVTTLTKRMAEDLAEYLEERGIKVTYLHSEVETLDRSDILDDLRSGKYDVLVGINLLREGLDLPEVSLVVILDADKEGFLRSETSLIQVMGRAARHISGTVLMYADVVTGSMQRAIDEISRRRKIQTDYNRKHNIKPQSIQKPIREKLIVRAKKEDKKNQRWYLPDAVVDDALKRAKDGQLLADDKEKLIKILKREMITAAKNLEFEKAVQIRDQLNYLSSSQISQNLI